MIAQLKALRPCTMLRHESSRIITFFTTGYEQSIPRDFLDRLQLHKVSLVVDVRQMPLSRKRGFSKNQLQELLAEEGIDYLHLKTLGAPKEIRDRLRQNGSWSEYVRGYERVLSERTDDIETLSTLAQERRICLLCFERNPQECHRSLVAERMQTWENGLKLKVEHIRY